MLGLDRALTLPRPSAVLWSRTGGDLFVFKFAASLYNRFDLMTGRREVESDSYTRFTA